MNKRASGVLMHITSLPGDYGIGSFGQAAYDFVDFLKETKQTFWQMLKTLTLGQILSLLTMLKFTKHVVQFLKKQLKQF